MRHLQLRPLDWISALKSWIEVSAARLGANYAAIRRAASPDVEVLCVIKADAYGHGAEDCALVLAAAGARWFGVFDVQEGERVRAALAGSGWAADDRHILVMCGFEPADVPSLLRADLRPVLWTLDQLDVLEAAAASANQHIAVHVEIDTGMARQGVCPGGDLERLARRLWASRWVRCEGIFTHLSSSEIAHADQTRRQQRRFAQAIEEVRRSGPIPEWIHVGNSAAIDESLPLSWIPPRSLMKPMVRPGLALFGYTLPLQAEEGDPAPVAHLAPDLHPVATWKTRILALRNLAPGDTVGYGATFLAAEPMRVALLPVGYADGLRREASGGSGWVMIAGQRAPVVGRVSMNLTVVDVTGHVPAPEPGDRVILLGKGVTAHDHARWCGTIAYEILCGMRGQRRLV